ncbi:MFS transporter [Paenibacillus sp. FSL R10-2782]|uniref:MFS transporter n=1 Tax=Paenibacillus sp. FSL R10-2782 TaxID=2954661 RepID=UPI003158ED9B
MQNREIQETPLYSLKLYNFFLYGAMVIFSSFFPLYLQEIGMDKLEIGSLMAIGPFVSVFANPFWGYTSDRSRNLRRILLFMIAGTLLLLQALFHVHTYVMIYVSMIGFYFFQSPLFAQSNSLILSYIEGTDRKFGSFRIWGSFGWAVTAAVAGLIIDQTGISSISTIFTVLLLAALICTLAIPPLKSSVETATIHLRGFGSILMNGYFISFILLGILVSIPNSINSAFMSLYITELGGSKLMLGFAVFMSSVFEIIVFLLFDRFLKKKMTVMVGCLALVSLLFALRWELMALATDPIQIVFIQALHCVTFGGYFYVGTQLTVLFTPIAYRSSGQAVYTLTWSGISGIVAGFAGGWLFQNFGGEMMYNAGVFFALLGFVGFTIMWYMLYKNGYKPCHSNDHKQAEEAP